MTNDYDNDFNEVMELLKTVPGAKEHMESIQVKLGKEIWKRRLELGWTQAKVVEELNTRGVTMTQPMLSKMESGLRNIEGETYQKVFDVLGGILELDITFGPVSDKSQKKRESLVIS
ncbi:MULTISPECIES: helix-turn-helix domain-containing protein [Bacillus cereus group]|uniref:helix-turn-helix domain-containing protein n=1 Tax=Bacillus cereus group TaxID=86661 RepID=UPI0011A0CDC6|nr:MULTISPECIES: helix-turn-helix transcriptional regulator [Bacillus cereus group]